MGTSGDKIVLLDGMGSGSGSAANGLLSMIPGMFTSLLGGNKMDPNLVAALMNGRNNQDQFGGANGWWLWIIVLFWLWGGRGFGNGKIVIMFKDLKKGYQVYTLDTSGVPKFFMGTVVNVSEPRFAQSQLGQYQQLQDRVMDLTIEVDGKSMTYVVPENQNVAMANGITLACSVDPIMNHLNAMKRTSTDIVNSVDKNKEIIEACDSILEDINPTFKQTKDQDRKIKNLEEKVDRMGSSFDELKELLIKKLG